MNKRILIFGSGVIGSVYGGLLAKAGYDVSLLARGKRLKDLQEKGLLLRRAMRPQAETETVGVRVVPELCPDEAYDYVFVTLRAEQVEEALPVLAANTSSCFVFMVNHAEGYDRWELTVGKGRVIAAFPGAGGRVDEEGKVFYSLTSRLIQPTTLGEPDGSLTPRIRELIRMLRKAGFPAVISRNMDAWQKTHLALVCPLACAIYCDGGNSRTLANNRQVLTQLCKALRETFAFIHRSGIGITPGKYRFMRLVPLPLMRFVLSRIYASSWAETFINDHTRHARGEMIHLTEALIALAALHGCELIELGRLLTGRIDSK